MRNMGKILSIADANGPYEATTYTVLVDISPDPLRLEAEGKWIIVQPSSLSRTHSYLSGYS